MDNILEKLGPLAALAGTWEGDQGIDIAPSDDRGVEKNSFREVMSFVPFGPINNHEQVLYGLKYSTTAWRLGEEPSFHEEQGYWLWDPKEKQVLRCFMIPRGVTVLAGGTVEPNSTEFKLVENINSSTYGICSNLFLDREFRTEKYELHITIENNDVLIYRETNFLRIKNQANLFEHTDQNRLKRK